MSSTTRRQSNSEVHRVEPASFFLSFSFFISLSARSTQPPHYINNNINYQTIKYWSTWRLLLILTTFLNQYLLALHLKSQSKRRWEWEISPRLVIFIALIISCSTSQLSTQSTSSLKHNNRNSLTHLLFKRDWLHKHTVHVKKLAWMISTRNFHLPINVKKITSPMK